MDYHRTEKGYLVRLDRGEELLSTLTRFLVEKDVRCGALTAIGAVENPELGLFTMASKEYKRRRFEGEYEIAALTGNVSTLEGRPFVHVHALLSAEDCTVVGGHLFEAVVAVTCEIDLSVYGSEVKRRRDEATTLNLLDFRA